MTSSQAFQASEIPQTSAVCDAFKDTEIGPIPVEWEVVRLGAVFDIQQGKALSPKVRSGLSPNPFLRTANVLWGEIDLSVVDQMDFSLEEIEKYALKQDDLLVCEGGEIGRTAIWQYPGIYCYQNHLHRLRTVRHDVVPLFYMYWMQAAFLHLNLYQGEGNKTTIPNLSRSRLAGFCLPKPPLPEQRRIAHVLSTIQRAIAAQDTVIAAARETKHSLMQRLFTYGPGPEPAPTKETEIGEIPEHWCVESLGEVVARGTGSVQTGPFGSLLHASDYVDSGFPVVMPKDLSDTGSILPEGIACIGPEDYDRLKRYHLQEGDLLVARRGEIGRRGLVTEREAGWVCGTGCLRVRPDDSLGSEYLRHAFGTNRLREWLTGHAIGTTMLNLSARILNEMPVPIPPPAEQLLIGDMLSAVDHKIAAEEQRKVALQALFKSMLQQLMTGQVRVPEGIASSASPGAADAVRP